MRVPFEAIPLKRVCLLRSIVRTLCVKDQLFKKRTKRKETNHRNESCYETFIE